jgi:superfamily II DNA or RNA helicase
MEENIRDKLQRIYADKWLETKRGILYLTPRFGKIYTTINILEKLESDITILLAYPDIEIKKSWEKDFKTRNFDDKFVTYTTHLSLKKFKGQKFGLIIVDEIHLLSPSQRVALSDLQDDNLVVLGLTGTLMAKTEKTLFDELCLPVVAEYSLAQGVIDKIIPDYEINIVHTPLDNTRLVRYSKGLKTEKKHFNDLTFVINKMDAQRKNANFLRLNRIRVIQKSYSKIQKTKHILNKYSDERILVFCGLVSIAESLGIPAYHGKVKDKKVFQDFVDGTTKHLAVVKIGNSGVTYASLGRVIINYFDSNAENLSQKIHRAMSMEFNNPEKVAKIVILTSMEEVELNWLRKALEFFDPLKIKYHNVKIKK